MELQLANQLQHHIADLLWKAESKEKVKDIIKVYGRDAEVVFHMIMAHYFDNEMDTDLAEAVIARVK